MIFHFISVIGIARRREDRGSFQFLSIAGDDGRFPVHNVCYGLEQRLGMCLNWFAGGEMSSEFFKRSELQLAVYLKTCTKILRTEQLKQRFERIRVMWNGGSLKKRTFSVF